MAEVKTEDGKKEKYLLYYDGETVSGKVCTHSVSKCEWHFVANLINECIPINSHLSIDLCIHQLVWAHGILRHEPRNRVLINFALFSRTQVNVTLKKPGSKLEHQGIKVELIGQIELYYDRGNHHEFTSLVRELARPGDLLQNTSYPFEFANVEKPFEVYVGSNVRLR